MKKKNKANTEAIALYKCQYNAAFQAVYAFFRSTYIVEAWMDSPNPLLGNVSPVEMLLAGRFVKLMGFIYTQLEENNER